MMDGRYKFTDIRLQRVPCRQLSCNVGVTLEAVVVSILSDCRSLPGQSDVLSNRIILAPSFGSLSDTQTRLFVLPSCHARPTVNPANCYEHLSLAIHTLLRNIRRLRELTRRQI